MTIHRMITPLAIGLPGDKATPNDAIQVSDNPIDNQYIYDSAMSQSSDSDFTSQSTGDFSEIFDSEAAPNSESESSHESEPEFQAGPLAVGG